MSVCPAARGVAAPGAIAAAALLQQQGIHDDHVPTPHTRLLATPTGWGALLCCCCCFVLLCCRHWFSPARPHLLEWAPKAPAATQMLLALGAQLWVLFHPSLCVCLQLQLCMSLNQATRVPVRQRLRLRHALGMPGGDGVLLRGTCSGPGYRCACGTSVAAARMAIRGHCVYNPVHVYTDARSCCSCDSRPGGRCAGCHSHQLPPPQGHVLDCSIDWWHIATTIMYFQKSS